MKPERLRTIGRAYQIAFDAGDPDDVASNRPYIGGHETAALGPRLRTIEPLAVLRPRDGITRRLRLGVWQNEFLREFLLGPETTATFARPGTDWLLPPDDRVEWLAGQPRHAHDLVRRWGDQLAH